MSSFFSLRKEKSVKKKANVKIIWVLQTNELQRPLMHGMNTLTETVLLNSIVFNNLTIRKCGLAQFETVSSSTDWWQL